ncbi:MAG: tetratricopeptide repeat protein [Gemmatimonadaceae bacterium]|nr:tetratricopeptide repeat protein [Gemmatimonadaceae bacterium]
MGTSASPSGKNNDLAIDPTAFVEWTKANSRSLLIAGAIVVVGGASVLFARQSAALRNERAEVAYGTAQGAFYSGNLTQAKTDLEALVGRYPSTSGGTQGAMLLAQILYNDGKHDEGIKRLTAIQGSAPRQFASALEELIAAGYADSNRPDQAADHYLKAADASPFPAEQDGFRADAARILEAAGKADQAKAIWTKLAAAPGSPSSVEASLRLGELAAKVATP